MKTLVNKNNPAIKIVAPSSAIKFVPEGDVFRSHWEIGEEILRADDWTLVEGIKGISEGIPSNVDLEKEIQRYLCEECSSDDEPTIKEIAHYFYKLGLKARKGV